MPSQAAPSARPRPWAPLLLLAAVGLAWGGSLGGGFRFDDYLNLVHDPATTSWPAFVERLGWGLRPLLRASYAADHALWGLRAGGFLSTHLLLHAATVLGVYALARRRLGTASGALVAALAFALQPAHAEAVAYLSGRSVLLASALLVAALVAHERAQAQPGQPAARAWRLASGLAFVLAVLARETALIYPLLLLAWEATRPGAARGPLVRGSVVRGSVAGLWPMLALATGLALLLLALPRYQELAAFTLALRPPLATLAQHAAALPELLSLWGRPWALSPVHPAPDATMPRVLAGLGLALGLGLVALGGRRRAPLAALAAAWVLLALLPTHSLLPRRDLIVERHLYLAWFGPCLLLGGLWQRWAVGPRPAWAPAATRRILAVGTAGLLVLGAGWGANRRVALWTDEVALWSDTVTKAPASPLAWNNLGAARKDAGDLPGAAAAFERALALDPTHRTARFNLLALELLHFRALDPRSRP